jgi:hypothetical protein
MKLANKVWKELKRHPLSAEYPDLTGPAAERMLEGLKKHGILNDRRIVLHDGMVLDGWQFYQACIAANVKPETRNAPRGMTPEEYVELANDTRRHETQETRAARASARRERVAEAKAAGKSNRQIADEERVAESTIRSDVEALRAQGAHVDPPMGQVTDTQGRKQPAKKGKPGESKAQMLARAMDADCDGELKDSLDNPVPPGLRPAFQAAATFRGILSQLAEIKKAVNSLSGGRGGDFLHPQEITLALDNARRAIRFAMPFAICPVCSGNTKQRRSGCPCKEKGWLPEENYNLLPQECRK